MQEVLQPYEVTIWCLVTMGGLLFVQLLVADVIGLTRGHTPGTALTSSHGDIHFRATRAHANTNESIASFLLLTIGGMALGVAPQYLNILAVVYCGARIAHMIFYWLNLAPLRSLSFIVSLCALLGMMVMGIAAAL